VVGCTSQSFGDFFLEVVHAVVHVLFFAEDVIFDVCLDLVSDFYHLFDRCGGFDLEDVVEGRAVSVAGFSVDDGLDLALKIFLANVEEGDEALLTVVNELVEVGDFDLALLDFRVHSSKGVLTLSGGIVGGLVDLWCQDCRRDCAGRPSAMDFSFSMAMASLMSLIVSLVTYPISFPLQMVRFR
jgi:hypothetical protein